MTSSTVSSPIASASHHRRFLAIEISVLEKRLKFSFGKGRNPVLGWPQRNEIVKEFLQRWLITTVAVLVAAHIVPGIEYTNVTDLFVASLLLGVLNAIARPILMLLSLPLVILSLGLFLLVINAGLLYFVGWVVKGFNVAGFWSAFFGALIISDEDKGGGGPIIDV
jgi:putative membrane protein